MKLVFATHNQNKFEEVKVLLPPYIELVSLTDIGCYDEIPETSETLQGNAQIKADFVTDHYNLPCFADDTGLLVDALNGAPGVYSARYAGEQKNAEDNMNKLLSELENKDSRSARFETVIALNLKEQNIHFTGVAKGQITKVKNGQKGFGYDPIFQPEGYEKTFAELSLEIKNTISHRGKAIQQLVTFLQKQSY
ncbi:non-canonical purine NTP diphosphatase [Maribacter algarum]|uniref:dITP/XTP pyrophosphatase n=1 Tax=Maribacter algarum (ex Zhang et al. 2020) TaxID=2578118 RepID=A0A5S3PHA2_9FLAO|nr:non-canonical purine NTP diphosphatase [Maribacter algarum]TMM53660.1 non-canonical purine NTP diphosphatase [Maribacter algarum]